MFNHVNLYHGKLNPLFILSSVSFVKNILHATSFLPGFTVYTQNNEFQRKTLFFGNNEMAGNFMYSMKVIKEYPRTDFSPTMKSSLSSINIEKRCSTAASLSLFSWFSKQTSVLRSSLFTVVSLGIHFFFFSCVLVNHWSSSFLL